MDVRKEDVPSASAEVSGATPRKSPFKRRGKQSYQKNKDRFTEKQGKKFMDDVIRPTLDRETFSDLDSLVNMLNKISISRAVETSQRPVTTRAYGFLVDIIYDSMVRECRHFFQQTQLTRAQFYRITLLQLAIQQNIAYRKFGDLQDPIQAPKQETFISEDASQRVLATKLMHPMIAVTISGVGYYTSGEEQFITHVPPHARRESPTGNTGKRARRLGDPDQEQDVILPDPYFVTFRTLRQVVEALSSQLTPAAVREYFRSHNPIPSATWSEAIGPDGNVNGPILDNPDDIMPLTPGDYYDSPVFSRDIANYRAAMNYASQRFRLQPFPFDGKANASCLVTLYKCGGMYIDAENGFVSGRQQIFRSPFHLTEMQLLMGAMMLSEYPEDCVSLNRNLLSFGQLEPYGAQVKMTVKWSAIVEDLLVKHVF